MKLNSLRADIVLMTTPQLEVLQIKRSKGVKHYCHIIHSLPHVDNYEVFALDYFDSIFTNSPIHNDFIRQVEKVRNLPTKQITITGCTYLDVLDSKLKKFQAQLAKNEILIYENQEIKPITSFFTNKADSDKYTILISPSWGREAILSKYGMKVISPLIDSNFNIIIRPHPQTYISESHILENLKAQTKDCPNIKWDSNIDNIYAMQEADLMLGDFSGILFDFLCLFSKPIATMEFNFNITGYDLEDIYDTPWVKGALQKIGRSIKDEEIPNLASVLESFLEDKSGILNKNIAEMKELLWHYQGTSAEVSTKELLKIHRNILESSLGEKYSIYQHLSCLNAILDSTTMYQTKDSNISENEMRNNIFSNQLQNKAQTAYNYSFVSNVGGGQ
ncbi:hypothetical protein CQA53_01170 [Helicobacter didelphidarum]|uniref:CDP-glycerol--glycerophosphate glycerophosphotransferase n=1 Tax=Helicobacter didelphidarum TaxID=2040648 RepID=A0A3D8ISN1_9HELI|nr:CDP-glycerol glycerophosphotransferase family protein [Helicobacter didelphidarum]RDU67644.1 hypothetical protein CQA53_01170 [Helicobacter didelphidarum]